MKQGVVVGVVSFVNYCVLNGTKTLMTALNLTAIEKRVDSCPMSTASSDTVDVSNLHYKNCYRACTVLESSPWL